MERVVITGATGFLGKNLTKKFYENGYEVWALVRPESKSKDKLKEFGDKIHVLECSIYDTKKIKTVIKHANAWFHFAWGGVNRAEIDSFEVQNKNINMSLCAIQNAQLLGCEIFMDAGSRVEYGVTDKIMKESLKCHPINAYGKAKLTFYQKAVDECKKTGMKYCHLRFFSVYGYGDHPWSIISTLLHELPQGNKVKLSACKHKWNFMYIDDAIDAVYSLYAAVVKNVSFKYGIFNVASEDTRELKEFVMEIHKILEEKGVLDFGAFVQAKEGPLSIVPDINALCQMTGGWREQYTFEKGIKETIRKGKLETNEKN